MDLNKLYNMDARAGLKQMIAEKQQVDCVITSPPYWSLRDYGIAPSIWDNYQEDCDHDWEMFETKEEGYADTKRWTHGYSREDRPDAWSKDIKKYGFCNECGAWLGALGLEPTFDLFIKHLADIYDLVWEVLKPTGTNWVNLGDSYGTNVNPKSNKNMIHYKRPMVKNYEKCLLMIPDRFAIEMIDNHGWTLRNKIVWHKPNAMPSSAKDRFTVDFEYIYFFVKRKKYYFEQLKEPITQSKANLDRRKYKPGKVDAGKYSKKEDKKAKPLAFNEYWSLGKNKRTVWSINTKANKEFHFATFPPKLVEPMIKAGCPRYVCKVCGEPAKKEYKEMRELEPGRKTLGLGPKTLQGKGEYPGLHHHTYRKFDGYSKCSCGGASKHGVVLDPFAGTGTTLYQAWKLGRDYIGFEVSEEYCEMAEKLLVKTKNKRITDF